MAANQTANNDGGSDWEFQTVPSKRSSSNAKRRLFMGNLPRSIGKKEVIQLLQQQLQLSQQEHTTTAVNALSQQEQEQEQEQEQRSLSSSFIVEEHQLELVQTKTCNRAFVSGLDNHQCKSLISRLDQSEIHLHPGRKLIVQLEQKKPQRQQQQGRNDNNKKTSFGAWAKPITTPNNDDDIDSKNIPNNYAAAPTSLQEAAERIESIVRDEQQHWADDYGGGGGDVDSAVLQDISLIAATAAVSLVTTGGFNVVIEDETCASDPSHNDEKKNQDDVGMENAPQDSASNPFQNPPQLLSSLLEEYGEYDPHWQEQPIPVADKSSSDNINEKQQLPAHSTQAVKTNEQQHTQKQQYDSRLGQHGKAPLHVDFISFGYRYDAPSTLRENGGCNTYAQPLPVLDTREFPPIPPHLFASQDGLSGLVRRILLDGTTTNATTKSPVVMKQKEEEKGEQDDQQESVTDSSKTMTLGQFASTIADQASDSLVDAMNRGGYGYALPLHMTIHVASEYGRHRSVVAVEAAATALRKCLRRNVDGRFRQPVSVGTRHRDITKQQQPHQHQKSRKQQQQQQQESVMAANKNRRRKNVIEEEDDDW